MVGETLSLHPGEDFLEYEHYERLEKEFCNYMAQPVYIYPDKFDRWVFNGFLAESGD